ncbi:CRP-like cAMP-binding protein [Sphingomonas xinjiangensis]|uniref:CRP-like cAMP-binding protein n=1 Tax=Sphingomonas xinjiangensis TaxID=643568 RepID=A0A840YJM0_9SPHN|nr:Crp/Fnr family transcriptional regulator [Sphingomonas xinjiangensis]MBB5709106.1 CRP-like cAMP-binding protein [Sphingomonas xinjiangensis]
MAAVSRSDAHASANALIRALPFDSRDTLLAACERQTFVCGHRLGTEGTPLIFFPETAIISVINQHGAEVGLVGFEGMTGWSILLGSLPLGLSSVIECSGSVLALPASELIRLCRHLPAIRAVVLRFIEVVVAQMVDAIGAAAHHGVSARLARRLLMLHDRGVGDSYEITHARLAEALAVRRASVTDCLHVLEGQRTLRCTRNRITVLDRPALVAEAGLTYGGAERAYRQIIGAFGKP